MSLDIGLPRNSRMSYYLDIDQAHTSTSPTPTMTNSRGHYESMTALGNPSILLHSAIFVHLHGMNCFERAYTQSGINLLHR